MVLFVKYHIASVSKMILTNGCTLWYASRKERSMKKPETITVKQLRPNLSHVLDQVQYDNQPYEIKRYGHIIAVLQPVEKKA